ncbi:MAG: dTDP-4-dehydrorhamnose 3,5-epimerase [Magnetococcales bacterium]|nr:dTDP-4-dehydrorhamnose 3,5-epimerase [Magnetococcales bacterium]
MEVEETGLPGVLVISPKVFGDARGFFVESYQAERYRSHGLPERFVQDNASLSRRGVIRGLHYQWPHPQGKLVQVLRGEIYDVAVDVRRGSPHFGRFTAVTLNGDSLRQIYIPPGFAHGFCVLSEEAIFHYKCTDYYHPEHERTLRWDDPALAIPWPLREAGVLSPKDAAAPLLAEMPEEFLPGLS